MNRLSLSSLQPLNRSTLFRACQGSEPVLTPLFWLMTIGLLLPCYGSLPLGLPTRPVAQPLEQQLHAATLPLRCHLQAIAESSARQTSGLS